MDTSHQNGHFLTRNHTLAVCDKTVRALGRDDIHLSASTWVCYDGACR